MQCPMTGMSAQVLGPAGSTDPGGIGVIGRVLQVLRARSALEGWSTRSTSRPLRAEGGVAQ